MSFRRRPATDCQPRTMPARYAGRCAESGQPIRPGDPILWHPRTRCAYRLDTAEYARWLESRPDAFDMLAEDDGARRCGLI